MSDVIDALLRGWIGKDASLEADTVPRKIDDSARSDTLPEEAANGR